MSNSAGDRIKTFRRAKGWTQQQLADAIQKSRSQVGEWEGGTAPSRENLKLLASALGVAPRDIGQAWDPEGPRLKHDVQQSYNPPQQPQGDAPPPSTAGVAMGPGDQALFAQIQHAWGLLRTTKERRRFVEHVRQFVHESTAPPRQERPKKAAR
jgi:transcriptional regulator with XRE-family HTH domain